MTDSLFDTCDALGLAEAVAQQQVTPAELLDETIDRIETLDQQLNVLTERDYDFASGLIAKGLPQGPFRGVPFLRKDEGATIEGLVTTMGMRLLAGNRISRTSTLARRYLDAGLVIFGSTIVPPFCVTIDTTPGPQGPCLNPWDTSRTPGGSSSGAGAVVGAGALPMAHGSDGGGSLRIPAAWSGAFTMKPSRGRLPFGPVYTEAWLGFATEGTITRSVRDCAAMMDATAGPETGSRYIAPEPKRRYLEETRHECQPLRVAVMDRTHSGEAFHDSHLEATNRTVSLLESLGHHIEVASPELPLEALSRELYKTAAVDIAVVTDRIAKSRGREIRDDELETLIATMRRRGRTVTGQEYAAINAISMECSFAFDHFMRNHDVVLSPTMPEPPLPLGEIYRDEHDFDAFREHQDRYLNLTMVQNVTGQPAMSVPLWQSASGLPVGMMFVGRYGDESTLFSLAAQLERAQPWWNTRPPRTSWKPHRGSMPVATERETR